MISLEFIALCLAATVNVPKDKRIYEYNEG